jgi:hypothetical protein
MLSDDSFSGENNIVRLLARYPRQTESGITKVDEGRIHVSRFVPIRYSRVQMIPELCGGRYAGFFTFAETIYGQIAPSRAINGVIRWSTCTIVRTIPGSPFRAVQASRSTRRIIVHYYSQIYAWPVASLSGLAESYIRRPFANGRICRERLECSANTRRMKQSFIYAYYYRYFLNVDSDISCLGCSRASTRPRYSHG